MSGISSLYIGQTGMKSNETDITTIGNNIANLNTIGFKGSRAVFADILNRSIIGSGGPSQVGQGTMISAVQRLETQGALLQTGVSTDLAVGGSGLFVVRGDNNGKSGLFYTRNGQFHLDANGALTTLDGHALEGYSADASGKVGTTLGDLEVGKATSSPNPTSQVLLGINLDPNAPVVAAGTNFDPTNPTATASFSTTQTIYDSLGNAHDVDIYFVHRAGGKWEWHAVTDGKQIQGGTPGQPTEIATGTIGFTTDGLLNTETGSAFNVHFSGASPQSVTLDFGNSITTDGGNGTGSTSFAGASSVSSVHQDGFGAGDLTFVSIDQDGNIQGSFSNGTTRVLGQVALAAFQAPDQLDDVGGNLLQQSAKSGDPSIGGANTGGRGKLFAGSLEQSNVDLTAEFTHMIIAQRGYEASSKTVTTADQMIQTAELLIR